MGSRPAEHMRCERCGDILVLDKGTYVCPCCGLVNQDVVFDESACAGSAPDRWGYGSFVYRPARTRLRQIQLSHTAVFAAMSRARRLAEELQRAMCLTSGEREIVLAEFHRLVKKAPKGSVAVSRAAILVALAYLLARERGKRVNLRSTVSHLRKNGTRVSVGDVMRALAYLRECGFLREASWTELLAHYSEAVSRVVPISAEELLHRAWRVLKAVRRYMTGRNRENVAAAIVYVCIERAGYSIPIFRFSRLVNVPATSLRSNVMLVRSLLLEEAFEEGSRDLLEDRGARDEAEEAFPVPVNDPAPLRAENYRGNSEKIFLSAHEHSSA